MVPVNTSAQPEQNVQDGSSKNPGSIAMVPDADGVERKDENEVSDDDWNDDWDTFQSLPATAAKDDEDSAIVVSPIREQGSVASSHKEQIPLGNTNQHTDDTDRTAGATEGRNSVDKEFEEPSASQCSFTEPQVKREFPEPSYEYGEEVTEHPTVDCSQPSAHFLVKLETRSELQQDQDDQFGYKETTNDDLDDSTDPTTEENSDVSGETESSQGDALDENTASRDDSTSSLNNLSGVMEDELRGCDMVSVSDDKSTELAPSSDTTNATDASMSGNVISRSETHDPDNVDNDPESYVGESSES